VAFALNNNLKNLTLTVLMNFRKGIIGIHSYKTLKLTWHLSPWQFSRSKKLPRGTSSVDLAAQILLYFTKMLL